MLPWKVYDGCQSWETSFIIQAFCATDLVNEYGPTIQRAYEFMKNSQVSFNLFIFKPLQVTNWPSWAMMKHNMHLCTWRFWGTTLVTKVNGIAIDRRVHGHFHLQTMGGLYLTLQEKHLRLFHLCLVFLLPQCIWVKVLFFLELEGELSAIILRRNETKVTKYHIN